MERQEAHICSVEQTTQPPTPREWLMAVLMLPITLQRLAMGVNRLADELEYHRQVPQALRYLDEVIQDLNGALYHFCGGRVTYNRPDLSVQKSVFKK
ncbi:MAG: hypothetical protein Q7R97_00190 [Candidatus Daviesbacteria bacterium]|nr:hypothetical protein [Candidatus Daviesbacteria bacterium]